MFSIASFASSLTDGWTDGWKDALMGHGGFGRDGAARRGRPERTAGEGRIRRTRGERGARIDARVLLLEGDETEPAVLLRRVIERDVHVLEIPERDERRVQERLRDLLVQAACRVGEEEREGKINRSIASDRRKRERIERWRIDRTSGAGTTRARGRSRRAPT
jgi:hypothetical protein